MDMFPDNATSHFITPLHKRLELMCDYEVALTEIHYPQAEENVREGDNKVEIHQVNTDVLREHSEVKKTFEEQTQVLERKVGRLRRRPVGDVKEKPIEMTKGTLRKPTHDVAAWGVKMLLAAFKKNASEETFGKTAQRNDLMITEKAYVPTGKYSHLSELLEPINTILREVATLAASPDGYVLVTVKTAIPPTSVYFSDSLCVQLGFPLRYDILNCDVSPRPCNLTFGSPEQIFVYADFVQPQIVGNTAAPLLRTVNSSTGHNPTYGLCSHILTKPYYVPVSKRSLDTVEINLRDKTGEHSSFATGSSTVVVHFRPQTNE